jgi:hypothetical protein
VGCGAVRKGGGKLKTCSKCRSTRFCDMEYIARTRRAATLGVPNQRPAGSMNREL